jgi:translation initiation factor IF-3
VPIAQARKIAQEKQLDLVKISPDAKPPVCKIINYSKYRYEQIKREKEARKRQKVFVVKEIRISLNIDTHDLEVKIKKAIQFLNEGNKVKLSIKFRGREMGHKESANALIREFIDKLNGICLIEKPATFENRSVFLILAPITKK